MGDAVGFVVEECAASVSRPYADAVLLDGLDYEGHKGPYALGQYSDDSQLARELMGSYVARGRFDPADYAVRTEQNVVDSDGTLILYIPPLVGGTELTSRLAAKHSRPCHTVDLSQPVDIAEVRVWLQQHGIRKLNIAGPRESTTP